MFRLACNRLILWEILWNVRWSISSHAVDDGSWMLSWIERKSGVIASLDCLLRAYATCTCAYTSFRPYPHHCAKLMNN